MSKIFNIRTLIFIALAMVFLWVSKEATTAQSATETADVSPGTMFLLRDYQLLELNAFSPQQLSTDVMETPLSLETFNPNAVSDWRVVSANIDQAENALFTIEGSGRTERQLPIDTRLVQTNLANGERTVILDQDGIFTFTLSPDQQRMIVGYYDGEYGVARRSSCILTFTNRECRQIPLQIGGNPGYWVDNQSYIVPTQNPLSLYLVNADTNELHQLSLPQEWYLYSAVPIPGTRTLLVSARLRSDTGTTPSQFLTLNIDTLELNDFAYDALSYDNYSGVGIWSFSPDGRYLLYGGGLKMALVEFQTGRLIREFDTLFNWGWVDNSTLVMQGIDASTGGGIVRLNADTGEASQLATPSEAGGILIIP